MTDREKLFGYLAESTENRTAFLAALIVERGRLPADGDDSPARRPNAYEAARIASNLVSLATRIHAFCEAECSRETDDRERFRYEATCTKFEEIARLLDFAPTTGGDCRGACAYIADPDYPADGDDMGGRGWGVYR